MRLGNETQRQGLPPRQGMRMRGVGVGVGRFMLHLENILALGDAVQRHAASEGISCQL